MKKAFVTLSLLPILFLSFAVPVFAQDDTGSNSGDDSGGNIGLQFKIQNPFSIGNNLFQVMQGILDNIIIPIGGMLCVLAFIWGGFQYVTAQGKPDAISKANRALLYAAIGTAILLGAKVIEELIRTTLTDVLA
jgi:hypothetical protein